MKIELTVNEARELFSGKRESSNVEIQVTHVKSDTIENVREGLFVRQEAVGYWYTFTATFPSGLQMESTVYLTRKDIEEFKEEGHSISTFLATLFA